MEEANRSPLQRAFRRKLDSLDEIFRFLGESCDDLGLTHEERFAVELVVDELFTNMIAHQPAASRDVLIALAKSEGALRVSLTDFDVAPFDIRAVPEPAVDRPLHERRPGGLGIHLIRRYVDRIDYEYADRRSTTTLIKNLGASDR